jgi:hypothetical protein
VDNFAFQHGIEPLPSLPPSRYTRRHRPRAPPTGRPLPLAPSPTVSRRHLASAPRTAALTYTTPPRSARMPPPTTRRRDLDPCCQPSLPRPTRRHLGRPMPRWPRTNHVVASVDPCVTTGHRAPSPRPKLSAQHRPIVGHLDQRRHGSSAVHERLRLPPAQHLGGRQHPCPGCSCRGH